MFVLHRPHTQQGAVLSSTNGFLDYYTWKTIKYSSIEIMLYITKYLFNGRLLRVQFSVNIYVHAEEEMYT